MIDYGKKKTIHELMIGCETLAILPCVLLISFEDEKAIRQLREIPWYTYMDFVRIMTVFLEILFFFYFVLLCMKPEDKHQLRRYCVAFAVYTVMRILYATMLFLLSMYFEKRKLYFFLAASIINSLYDAIFMIVQYQCFMKYFNVNGYIKNTYTLTQIMDSTQGDAAPAGSPRIVPNLTQTAIVGEVGERQQRNYNQKRYKFKRRGDSRLSGGGAGSSNDILTGHSIIGLQQQAKKEEMDALTSLERDVLKRTQQAQQCGSQEDVISVPRELIERLVRENRQLKEASGQAHQGESNKSTALPDINSVD